MAALTEALGEARKARDVQKAQRDRLLELRDATDLDTNEFDVAALFTAAHRACPRGAEQAAQRDAA